MQTSPRSFAVASGSPWVTRLQVPTGSFEKATATSNLGSLKPPKSLHQKAVSR